MRTSNSAAVFLLHIFFAAHNNGFDPVFLGHRNLCLSDRIRTKVGKEKAQTLNNEHELAHLMRV
jgi:hypothetical protein